MCVLRPMVSKPSGTKVIGPRMTSHKHHYVPRFYLKGFTLKGTEDDSLWVFDQEMKRAWKGSPKKDAYQKNFHEVDLPGFDKMSVESTLGEKVESPMAAVLADILKNKRLPIEPLARDIFLNFVAFTAARSPQFREAMAEVVDRRAKEELRQKLKDPSQVEVLRQLHSSMETDVPFEEVIKFDDDDFTVSWDQTSIVGAMLLNHDHFLEAAAKRHWNLWFVAEGLPDLVCADLSVTIWPLRHPKEAFQDCGLRHWNDPDVMLVMPLDRRMAAVGLLQGEPVVHNLNLEGVGVVNYHVAQFSRQVYSSTPEFPIWQIDKLCIARAGDWMSSKSNP